MGHVLSRSNDPGMDDQSLNVGSQHSDDSAHQVWIHSSNDLKKYRQLNSAIIKGQKEIIKLLLKVGVPVNPHRTFNALRSPLHSSVHLGDPKIVKELLSRGASVNASYACDTPLTLAAKFRRYEIVDLLLLAEGLENCRNNEGITHFHIACMRNQVDVAQKLLLNKQDVNAAVNFSSDHWPSFTPLHFAVQFECIETIAFLLKVGADITLRDAKYHTPLHLANMFRNEQIIDMILMTHEKIASNPTDSKGLSHFHIACSRNKPSIVEHFLKLGVNPEEPTYSRDNESSWNYKTAIDFAIHYECLDVIQLLLQSSTCVPIIDDAKCERIKNAYCTGNLKIVEMLEANKKLSQRSVDIGTISHILKLFDYDNIEMFENVLSEMPRNLNFPIIPTGCTLLHSSISHRSLKISKFLLTHGANFIIQDTQGKSPLHLAFEYNMDELVDLMLTDHVNYNQNPTDNDGVSHLHIACIKNYANIVEHLLKLGNNVNSSVNSDATFWPGYSPLHFAAEFGSDRVVQTLLEYGANYSATNASNLSAFDIALLAANKTHKKRSFRVMKSIILFHSHCKDNIFNDRGVTPLHLVGINSDFGQSSLSEINEILRNANDLNVAVHKMNTSWDGYTPLHFASLRFFGTYPELLMRWGADILRQASNGDTPLHLLNDCLGPPPLITYDFHDLRFLHLNHIGTTGFSIFHQACARTDLELMKYFLQHGVDVNSPSLIEGLGCNGYAPLHLAVLGDWDPYYVKAGAVRLLLDHNANPNIVDHQKNTPLHLMFHTRDHRIIDILVIYGADVNALNIDFETPLMVVCNNPRMESEDLNRIVLSFLDNGADINLTDERGITPLSPNRWRDRHEIEDCSIVIDTLLAHVIKLRTLGFYVSEANIKSYSLLRENFAGQLHFVEGSFTQQCVKEIELMKQTYAGSYMNLYDIIFQGPHKLAVASQNGIFPQIVVANDFFEKFPFYGFILKLQLRQGLMRWLLLKESRKILNCILRMELPRLCVELIMQYLDNQDLDNLIIMSEGKL